MKQGITYSLIFLFLSACASFPDAFKEAPLSATLNEIKKELRVFNSELKKGYEAKDKNGDVVTLPYQFSCKASKDKVKNYNAAEEFSIKEIKVSVTIKKSKSGKSEGGIVIASALEVGKSKSRESTTSDKLVLKLKPDLKSVPDDQIPETMSDDGIAVNLLSVVRQFTETDDTQPCLTGLESTLTLGFEVEDVKETGGELDLVVISIGGEKSRTNNYAHELEVKFDFGGAQTF